MLLADLALKLKVIDDFPAQMLKMKLFSQNSNVLNGNFTSENRASFESWIGSDTITLPF